MTKRIEDISNLLKTVENNHNQLEVALNNQNDFNNKNVKEFKVISQCSKENLDKNKLLYAELNQQTVINNELERKINILTDENHEIKAKYQELINEKDRIEGVNKKVDLELDNLRRTSKNLNGNLISIQTNNNEIKHEIYSCLSLVKIILNKFITVSTEKEVFSKNFFENISKIHEEINKIELDKNLILIIKIFEEFIRLISFEVDVNTRFN